MSKSTSNSTQKSVAHDDTMSIICPLEFELAAIIADLLQASTYEVFSAFEVPPEGMGNLALPCFQYAKVMRKAPMAIAADISKTLDTKKPSWLLRADAVGPYVNFHVSAAKLAHVVIKNVLEKESYGSVEQGAGKCVLVEYSSPNIAKHFHMGHLGTTIIGRALYNIYKFLGYETIGINHLGDWGTQFGKLITAFVRWSTPDEVTKGGIDELVRLYVRFHNEADQNPDLDEEARSWVVKMESGDAEGLRIWKWFVDISMAEFERIYERFGIDFDLIRGESYYSNKLADAVLTLEQSGLLSISEGAKIVDLAEYGMPPCLILRSDGGTLYPTRDIAAAIDRFNTFNFDKCLYVTGNEQSLHFAQWMKVVELMGNDWAAGLVHVSYGMYLFEGGKMSTRRGEVIKMDDLLYEACQKTADIIEEKNPSLENKEEVARQVGIGAVVFNRLYNSRAKDTLFSFERMLSFDGETGPYVMYTHARICSVLERGAFEYGGFDAVELASDVTLRLVWLLYEFPKAVHQAHIKYEPYIVARHMMAVCTAFNTFYNEYTILADDLGVRNARLSLCAATQRCLARGLGLLGMSAPQKM